MGSRGKQVDSGWGLKAMARGAWAMGRATLPRVTEGVSEEGEALGISPGSPSWLAA